MAKFGILLITGIAFIVIVSMVITTVETAPLSTPLSLTNDPNQPRMEPRQITRDPRPITVVINAGDGGRAPGAVVGGVMEKDINLAVALRVLALTRSDPRLGVVLTRMTDRYIAHRDRLKIAERAGAALYLSIHTNAALTTQARGIETWVDDSRGPTDRSWLLAEAVQRGVIASVGAVDRGVRSQRLYMRHTRLPAVLLEVGFLTHPAERRLLLTPEHQDRIARGIVNGILDFLNL